MLPRGYAGRQLCAPEQRLSGKTTIPACLLKKAGTLHVWLIAQPPSAASKSAKTSHHPQPLELIPNGDPDLRKLDFSRSFFRVELSGAPSW
jgi:hypothetical protein